MKKMRISFILLSSLLLISACNNASSNSGSNSDKKSIIVTDMVGREVEVIPGSYKRVVCIGAGALRMYSYIGDVNLLAGVEDIDNISLTDRPKMFDGVARPYFIAYQDIFKELRSCGVGGPNAQIVEEAKILACNPDIVISEYEDVKIANDLQTYLEVPVLTLKYGSKGVFDDYVKQSFEMLGKAFDKEERALELNNYIDVCKNDIFNRTANLNNEESSKKVYVCGLGQWGTTNHLMTAKNYEPFNVAHINNICDSVLTNNGIQSIEEEVFVDIGKDVDVMIIDAAAVKNIKPLYQNNPTMFDECKAWQEGEVYLQMPYNAYYTNLEIVLINTYFNAKCVYPELFLDIDMDELTDEVTFKFLDEKLNDEIKTYQHSYGGYQKIDTNTFFN